MDHSEKNQCSSHLYVSLPFKYIAALFYQKEAIRITVSNSLGKNEKTFDFNQK